MPVRLTGMASGLDTDTLIKGMMDAQKLKNKKVSDKSQINEWKQERLKELNTKLYKLYAEDLTKLKTQGAYNTKKVTSSNENVVNITGNTNATNGNHTLSNITLASSQFLTSSPLGQLANGSKVTTATKLTGLEMGDGTLITIATKDGQKTFDVNENSTISDFVNFAKNAGINASFDATQGRFFLSSKNSGKDSWFALTTQNDPAITDRRNIDSAIGYSSLSVAEQNKVNDTYYTLKNSSVDTEEYKKATEYLDGLAKEKNKKDALAEATSLVKKDIIDEIEANGEYIKDGINISAEAMVKLNEDVEKQIREKYKLDEFTELSVEQLDEVKGIVNKSIGSKVDSELSTTNGKELVKARQNELLNAGESGQFSEERIEKNLSDSITNYSREDVTRTVANELTNLGLTELNMVDGKIEASINPDDYSDANNLPHFTESSNSSIIYNGVELTSTTNTIQVNGLTIAIKGNSTETINMTVSNDTQAIFDSVKKFVTNYNAIIKEMNEVYYAGSARDYAPLSDDERESMSDSQIEKWEKKIKDSMLRRDSSIGNVLNGMKQSVMMSVKASDGKTYSLASLGIGTSSDYTEKGLLHIDGNPDDPGYSNYKNKLMNMLESDPDVVSEIMSKTMDNLYKDIDTKIKAIPNVRSAFTFYNDKTMSTQQTAYKKKIALLEAKLVTIESKYYKQFAAMEKAMANLQSQSNSLAGLLGNNSQQ